MEIALARTQVGQKSKTVDRVDCQEGQPEVKGHTSQGRKVDAGPAVRFLCRPVKQGWNQGDQEQEDVYAQYDYQAFTVVLHIVAEPTWAGACDCRFERHICCLTFQRSLV